METNILTLALALSDRELLARIGAIAGREREATAELVAHLAALEVRPRAYAAEGYGSLFDYCTRALRLSEDAACNRIEAARACRRFPVILDLLAAGSLTLTSVRKLRGHLTPENHEAVLRRAAHRTKEQIEALIAELAPKPDVPASVRQLPGTKATVMERGPSERSGEGPSTQPSLLDAGSRTSAPRTVSTSCQSEAASEIEAGASATGPGEPCGEPRAPFPQCLAAPRIPRPILQALAPQRYRVQFTIGQETHDRLRRVQALLRRQIPDGDPAAIFDRALRLLEEAERRKRGFAATSRASPYASSRNYENRIRSGTDRRLPRRLGPSRSIPTVVKRAVWSRDAGQCAFVSEAGRRCAERSFLELHHLQPYALDGPATVANIALRCRRHNQYEAEMVFGAEKAAKEGRVPSARLRVGSQGRESP